MRSKNLNLKIKISISTSSLNLTTDLRIFSEITGSLSSLGDEENSLPLERYVGSVGEFQVIFTNLAMEIGHNIICSISILYLWICLKEIL